VLPKCQVEIAEGKYLDKKRAPQCTFNELAALYLPWAQTKHRSFVATKSRVALLCETFGDLRFGEISPLIVDSYTSQRAVVVKPATDTRDVVGLCHIEMTLRYTHLAPDYKRSEITQRDTDMGSRRIAKRDNQAVNP
jgi:hypothetical protein